MRKSIEQLVKGELIEVAQLDGNGAGATQITLTPTGQQTFDKLTTAYHESLTKLLNGWSPEQEAELATLLARVSKNLLHNDMDTRMLAGAGRGA